jgi:hypothetical protein
MQCDPEHSMDIPNDRYTFRISRLFNHNLVLDLRRIAVKEFIKNYVGER